MVNMFEDDDNDDGEDIFQPSQGGLSNLFRGKSAATASGSGSASPATSSLKYQAPKQSDVVVAEQKQQPEVNNQPPTVVNAFAWDGKAYKPFGKAGLTLVEKESKTWLVLFRSKQQTLSMLDLASDKYNLQIMSDKVISYIDSQVNLIIDISYFCDFTSFFLIRVGHGPYSLKLSKSWKIQLKR